METWLPLYVAVVGALGAIGVAFWNSRGESSDLRQLKAMNDVLTSLPADADATEAFSNARDGLVVRVAAHTAATPRRRRLAWRIAQIVLGLAVAVGGVLLAAPLLTANQMSWLVNLVAALSAAGAAVFLMLNTRKLRNAQQVAEDERATVEMMLSLMLHDPKKGSAAAGE